MSNHWFIIDSLDDLAGYFATKAREMNEIAQKRTGLAKHHYNGQAHAFNDVAIMIRATKFAKKGKKSGPAKERDRQTEAGDNAADSPALPGRSGPAERTKL